MKKVKLKKKVSKVASNDGKTTKSTNEKKVTWKSVLSILLIIAIVGVSLILVFALYIVLTSPNFDKQQLYQKEPTILYDKTGKEFARVGAENSTVISYDDIPDVMIDALIATEDSRFFQHTGLDLFRFLKASVLQLLGNDSAGGASTLSMQIMKRTYNGDEAHGIPGIIRKFKDIYMAVFKLEANYTKEEIIEFYLNSQWFASDGNINYNGIVGIEQASIFYFGKSSKDLNLAEASLLAGMFQNPTQYNIYRFPDKCRTRQKTVLKLMVRHGYITQEEMDAVLKIPISSMVVEKQKTTDKVESSQAFIDYVLNQVADDLKLNAHSTSLKIYTTFDPTIQKYLEAVENGEVHSYIDDVIQEGIAVTSVEDGSIVALSGGRNYQAKSTNFATDIRRQPGSTAKPIFDYAMYVENISQSTYAMFLDTPTKYSTGQSITDYDNKYRGLLTMRECLRDSRNIPALKAFKAVYKIDPKIIADFVHSVGIDYGKDLVESASIGGFDGVSPLQMSAAYATFGRGGYYIEPYSYTKVINNETGKVINHSYSKEKVMEESTAYIMNNILDSVYSGSGNNVAGKTGTTNLPSDVKSQYSLPGGAIRDAWIISYSSKYSISFWYGYEDLTKFSEAYAANKAAGKKDYFNSTTGGNMRSSVMSKLAGQIHKGIKAWNVPKTVTQANVELETFPAQLCSAYTPSDMCSTEWFVTGAEPTDVSSRYDTLSNPTNATSSVNGSTITLKWTPIKTPDAIDSDYLSKHFQQYYDVDANEYYNKRISYNNSYIGSIGYEVSVKLPNGTEQSLGWTNNSSITFNAPIGGEYTFTIKSAYSIFKSNRSSGITHTVKTIDSNIGNSGGPTDDDDNNTQTPEPENDTESTN